MLKKDLRTHFLELRANTPASTLTKASLDISENVLKLPLWDLATFHIFLHSIEKKELDTRLIIDNLREKNKNILVPRMSPNQELQHIQLTEDTILEVNRWGIPEPVNGDTISPDAIDVVFTPLLAFDRQGYRVGYGKGYYDRFFAQCRKDCIKIGLSQFEAVDEITDKDKHDIPLNYCVTPLRIYEF
ncbi:5-formyltetrahydrofolate cyclo-ligase [Muriicola marianensis]|uniref:5-formyltetrahydrofolate cyclo-ligase n=1 Tax=Muriicola marianensis TaxID=1324801 RepID=A0ABQ1R1C9_9FLAO|nr:5-formyltetrahydrofolate cyclo-ligase [Muriicola marianensis]GGD51713.1 5-formyltetrahydrofolate cyclo-ligase [Muriicola marianensis]